MKQETALDILKTGRNVYLTGAAGSGKTYVLNKYISYLREHNVSVGITASTGIAATHLGGMTIHSWSGVGIKDYLSEWDLDALSQRQPLVKRLERTQVLLIDEVSMLRPELLDMVDSVARTLRRNDEPFGGMQVILSGDFFQLPPIVRSGDSDAFADSSRAWHEGDFRVCYLTEQYRQDDSDALVAILNDIRDGEISVSSQEALESRMGDAVECVSDAVVLHTHNDNVDSRNVEELNKLDGTAVTYEMSSSGRANLVESLKKNVLAPEHLTLKVGARVMFVKNSPDQEYVNGTLGEVVDLNEEYPKVKTHDGKLITAHPVSWETTDDGKVLASVTQVPLRLAWAITVHKSQGMSLDAVEVDLSRAFTPGQGYVALSRARTLDGLVLRGINRMALQVHPYVGVRDAQLQAESDQWERVIAKFSKEKLGSLHHEFIARVGNSAPTEKQQSDRVPTHLQTLQLLEEGKSLVDIAESRGLTPGTILSHVEKLHAQGSTAALAHLQPDAATVREVSEAYTKLKTRSLSALHRKLKGKYEYDELRLARLFITE